MKRSLYLLLLLSGCSLQDPYRVPALDIPCDWQTPLPEVDHDECFNWWTHLNDPMLSALMLMASEGNLDLQISMMRVLQARTEANGKKGDLYPRLDGSFNCGHVSFNKKVLDSLVRKSCLKSSSLSFFEIGFDAEWELDFFGKTEHEIAAAKAHAEAIEEDLSAVWVTLSAEIAKNYVELRGFQNRLQLLLEKVEIQTLELSLNEELKSRGLIKSPDLNQIIAAQSLTEAEIPIIQLNISKTINRISILLGYNPGELSDYLSCYQPLQLPCTAPIGLPSELLQRRPDIRKAERELASATEKIGSAIASLFPRFSLWGFVGDVSAKGGSLFDSSSFTWGVGPQVVVPIFNSRLLLQDVEYNKLATQEALYTYQKTVIEALEEAENSIAAYSAGEIALNHIRKASQILQESEDQEETLRKKGLSSTLSLIAVRKQALSAKDTEIQEEVAQLLRYIAVYKALGGSWENCQ